MSDRVKAQAVTSQEWVANHQLATYEPCPSVEEDSDARTPTSMEGLLPGIDLEALRVNLAGTARRPKDLRNWVLNVGQEWFSREVAGDTRKGVQPLFLSAEECRRLRESVTPGWSKVDYAKAWNTSPMAFDLIEADGLWGSNESWNDPPAVRSWHITWFYLVLRVLDENA